MENKYSYSTAADYARMTGFHRTTIVEWIKAGKLGVFNQKNKKPNAHWKICQKDMKRKVVVALKSQKPYPKHGKSYSDTELYVLMNNQHLPAKTIAKMIGRNERSVRIKLCRMQKANGRN